MPINLEYPGAECPDCQEPIPDEFEAGDACEGCGFVFKEPGPALQSAIHETFDHIRTWVAEDYRLEMYDTFQTSHGKSILAYEFFLKDELVFSGRDYGCAPSHTIDGDQSVAGLLAFIALKPGDTDREYFEDYTAAQLEFANEHGENLHHYVDEPEQTAGR
jgi:hypothetical protein